MLRRCLAALTVASASFLLYYATLLPGFDFGDTGSFQAIVGNAIITPRDSYPLYFFLGGIALRLVGGDPAHVLNLMSAIEAAVACGVMVLVAVELTGSIGAAVAAALLFATSYTFWSQSIIAEVYALHAVFVSLTLLLLLRWAARPSLPRLTLFFIVYAIGFGNHLSMILLAPGYTVFLMMAAPRRWRDVLRWPVIVLAVVCASIGALQYGWNLRSLWLDPTPPLGLWDALRTFWFDVTKSDWRDTMVMNVPQSLWADHLAMYWFDLKQQFGLAGPFLAALGAFQLARTNLPRAALFSLLYLVNAAFAYSYNVGDTHVFYIPSHFVVALVAAPGLVCAGRALASSTRALAANSTRVLAANSTPLVAALLSIYAGGRAYHDFPALDRSHDARPTEVLSSLTTGADDQHVILVSDLNWQIQNGLSYFTKALHPEIAVARIEDVQLYLPALVADNNAISRKVALTERARDEVVASYGPLLPVSADSLVSVTRPSDLGETIPKGSRYVLCVLRPSRDGQLDEEEVARFVRSITGATNALGSRETRGDYAVLAGRTGEAPVLSFESSSPFVRRLEIGGVDVEIRMESWLTSDTIRRMGFGHVIANRTHTLIVERGLSFVTFDEAGGPMNVAYAGNIFEPQPRFVIAGE